jgi:beta-lactamase superfamily II metal-dependent hydrolase
VLNNDLDFPGTEGRDLNNDSRVFQLIYQPAVDVKVRALFTGDIEKDQGEMLVAEYGDELKSDIVKIPHHGSDHLFDEFPIKVAAKFAYVSSTGTHGNFKHPRKSALDRYALTAKIFCTCDEDLDDHHITVTVDEVGNIETTDQVPNLVRDRDSNDVLQMITITPPP